MASDCFLVLLSSTGFPFISSFSPFSPILSAQPSASNFHLPFYSSCSMPLNLLFSFHRNRNLRAFTNQFLDKIICYLVFNSIAFIANAFRNKVKLFELKILGKMYIGYFIRRKTKSFLTIITIKMYMQIVMSALFAITAAQGILCKSRPVRNMMNQSFLFESF